MDLKTCIEMKVDFMDMNKGYLYHIQDYFHAKKLGLPTEGVRITCGNTTVGFITEVDLERYTKD